MIMKKLMNDPFKVTDELVEGFVLANSGRYRQLPGINVVLRSDIPKKGKVAVVVGGGSGHEPLFLEYIGPGMGDCSVHGNIFASPSVDIIYDGIKAADSGAGVILIYGNYQGDILNFEMAQDMARADGIQIDTVRIWDDVASASPDNKEERRGTAADIMVIKAAGAAAEAGLSFEEVFRVAQKARDNCRSIGVALSSCTLPAVGKPIFEIEDDSMMVGMGVHGEPGIKKTKLMTADDATDMMAELIFGDDLPLSKGDEIGLIVNSYGSTTRMELLIIARRLYQVFGEKGIAIRGCYYGDLCTSQEMAGVSITVMKLDEELKKHYDAPAYCPALATL